MSQNIDERLITWLPICCWFCSTVVNRSIRPTSSVIFWSIFVKESRIKSWPSRIVRNSRSYSVSYYNTEVESFFISICKNLNFTSCCSLKWVVASGWSFRKLKDKEEKYLWNGTNWKKSRTQLVVVSILVDIFRILLGISWLVLRLQLDFVQIFLDFDTC